MSIRDKVKSIQAGYEDSLARNFNFKDIDMVQKERFL